jgi:general secretion pathway protein G
MLKIFKTNNFRGKNDEAGFTLIELLIVIVVLGILMSMAVPALSGVKNKADTAVAKADLHNIMQSLEMYYLDEGEYPGQGTKGELGTISSNLDELNIKNDAEVYDYVTDSDTGAEKYLISYEAAADEFYYISTDTSALIGPETTAPSL